MYFYNIAAVMVIITIWCHLDRGGRETFVPLFSLSLSFRLPSFCFVFDNANINNRTPHAYLYNIAAVMVIITIWYHLDRGGRESFVPRTASDNFTPVQSFMSSSHFPCSCPLLCHDFVLHEFLA